MKLSKAIKALDKMWAFALENDGRAGEFEPHGPNYYVAYNSRKKEFEVYPAHIYPEPMLPSFSSEEIAKKCIYNFDKELVPIYIEE